MKICNSWIYFYIVLNKHWHMYWSEQSFNGLGPEDRCLSWGLLGIPETCYVLLVLGQRTGAHREDCLLFQKRVMFYWSWAGGLVLVVRTACCSRNVLCFTGLGPEDWYSSWGLLVVPETCYVLLVLGRRTGTHREDCLLFQKRVMFYWSWAGGLVLIVRTACCSRNVLCFTGLGPEDWCSSWGLIVMGTKLDIYVCITGFQNKSVRYIKKLWWQKYSRLWCIKDYHPSFSLYLPVDYIISTCDHRNTVDYDVLKIIILPSRYIYLMTT
jgi:hypothetical protein